MSELLLNQVILKKPLRRIKRFFRKFSSYFMGLSVFLLVGLCLWLFFLGVTKSSYFALKQVEVVGNLKELTQPEVLKASGLSLKTNLFRIPLKEVEKNILQLPWVHSVLIRREIPATLWVHVKEKKAKAILLDKKLYFVSKEGVAFKEVESELALDLPVITGLRKEDSLVDAMGLVEFLREIPNFKVFGLSEIHYNEAEGFSIVTLLGPMEIKLGKENFETKIERLKTIWSSFGTRLGRIRGLDLDYEDRAFVKL